MKSDLQHNHIFQQSSRVNFYKGERKKESKKLIAFQGVFVDCNKTRLKRWERFSLSKHLLPIISQINRCEGRIQLPTARWWLFLHFIPTAALGKYLTEAITIHCWKSNNQHCIMDKGPFTSWPLMNAAVSPCSGFSFILCSLFPGHTNVTPFDKAPARATGQRAHKHTMFSVHPFTILANLQFALGWRGNDTTLPTGRVAENTQAHCQQPAWGAADSPAWHSWREVSKLAALLPFALPRVTLGNCS